MNSPRAVNWLASGDFNGDGVADLVTSDALPAQGFSVYLGEG